MAFSCPDSGDGASGGEAAWREDVVVVVDVVVALFVALLKKQKMQAHPSKSIGA